MLRFLESLLDQMAQHVLMPLVLALLILVIGALPSQNGAALTTRPAVSSAVDDAMSASQELMVLRSIRIQ
ncbi:MAG: hypothetical protein FJX76_24515 [Armatimonadetes bacterium]|nr:hypothetical protein [Armatimonadota bacterium]